MIVEGKVIEHSDSTPELKVELSNGNKGQILVRKADNAMYLETPQGTTYVDKYEINLEKNTVKIYCISPYKQHRPFLHSTWGEAAAKSDK